MSTPLPSGHGRSAEPGAEVTERSRASRKKVSRGKDEPQPAGAFLRVTLEVQLRALLAADVLARAGDPEGVHDLRVACRRLRSLLAAFRPAFEGRVTEPLDAELKRLAAELSAARDRHVALEHLRELLARQPPELVIGPVAARLGTAARPRDGAADGDGVGRTLTDERWLAFLDRLVGLPDDPPLTPTVVKSAAEVLTSEIRRSRRRWRRAVDAARSDPGADRLHEVRKTAKRIRYTAETAVPVLGGPARELAGCMRQAQDLLGERQDTVLTRELCQALGAAAHAAGESAWTYGRLHALEEARAERAAAAFWAMEPALTRILHEASTRR